MVDRIPKLDKNLGEHMRIDGVFDENEQKNQSEDDANEEQEDGFIRDHPLKKTQQSKMNLKNLTEYTLLKEDIENVFLHSVKVQSDSGLVELTIDLHTGQTYQNVVVVLSHMHAIKLQNFTGNFISLKHLFQDSRESLKILVDESLKEEQTQISFKNKEVTFSKTIKKMFGKNNFWIRIGVIDRKNGKWNNEIIGVYVTILVVILFLLLVFLVLS